MKVIGIFRKEDGAEWKKDFRSFLEAAAYMEKHFGEYVSAEAKQVEGDYTGD